MQYQSPTNVTLIRTPKDLILVDMGSGDHFMPSAGRLWDNLKAAGIDKSKITKVVFTQGHPDHLWGTVDDLDDLTVPDATYYVAAAEWDFWRGDDAIRGLPVERAGFVIPTTFLNFAPASASKRFPALSKSDPRITPMWKFVAEARRVLWTFVELGFLAVLAIILIHLLLGEGAGSYVTSVSDNVTKFATASSSGMLGIVIVLAIIFLVLKRGGVPGSKARG